MIKEIDGKTRTCGLVGNPVEHTLSPVIHNYLAERMGHNLIYLPFYVEKDIQKAIEGAYSLNILGMNVTVPYKNAVMPYLDEVDENANKIGSINTLVRGEKGWKGYNTDYMGLYCAMKEEKIVIENRKVVVLGAGGAAMSTVYLCAKEGAKEIYILNRTIEKAEQISESVHRHFTGINIIPMQIQEHSRLEGGDYIAFQTTSVGLAPNSKEAVIEDKLFYKKIGQAVDIIYNPGETRFMQLVKEQGGLACNGLKMLLYQGISSYELWNQVKIPNTIVQEVSQRLEKEFISYA